MKRRAVILGLTSSVTSAADKEGSGNKPVISKSFMVFEHECLNMKNSQHHIDKVFNLFQGGRRAPWGRWAAPMKAAVGGTLVPSQKQTNFTRNSLHLAILHNNDL